jgi:hypothetical protein
LPAGVLTQTLKALREYALDSKNLCRAFLGI